MRIKEIKEREKKNEEIGDLRKRVIEKKMESMCSDRERYEENDQEILLLKDGGKMMDYKNWSKRK